MDLLTTTLVFAAVGFMLRTGEQRQRIALLSGQLGPFQIEKLMERLHEGYQRALAEGDPARRAQIWPLQESTERELAGQFRRFAESFGKTEAVHARINFIPLPYAHRWLPGFLVPGCDARELMRMHASGIERTVANEDRLSPSDRARALLAEVYLMQHSCHWFCRSRSLATARLMARHKTTLAQALDTVSPATQRAYAALTGMKPSKAR
ncbi:hypothetical protein [Hydrogenophaga sp. RWCD_12]|uniref:hypothetical protein n=1 Tax=Hydrogenophaga sp. RWCD_12 TaxID=3391190 RepID=UPI003984F39F